MSNAENDDLFIEEPPLTEILAEKKPSRTSPPASGPQVSLSVFSMKVSEFGPHRARNQFGDPVDGNRDIFVIRVDAQKTISPRDQETIYTALTAQLRAKKRQNATASPYELSFCKDWDGEMAILLMPDPSKEYSKELYQNLFRELGRSASNIAKEYQT